MILLGVNVLFYAVNSDAPHHKSIRSWLESAFSSVEQIGLAWVVIVAFLRLTTRPGLFTHPLAAEDSFSILQSWLDHPSVVIAHPGTEHVRILRQLLERSGTGGNLTTDAHLAALAMEHDAQLCSLDNDFARFAGLRWTNPLK